MIQIMKKLIKIITPKSIINYFSEINRKIENLEQSLDILIESPIYISSEEAFNSQLHRQNIFKKIINHIPIEVIIETGTHVGNTTGFMTEISNANIYTTEINDRFNKIAKNRLKKFNSIKFYNLESTIFLNKLSVGDLIQKNSFFYLDAHAHWYSYLPLIDEIEIIGKSWKKFIIMIDDFEHPNDEGYFYEEYGSGEKISLNLIHKIIKKYNLLCFFPTISSSEETGAKKGCILITNDKEYATIFEDKIEEIKKYLL